MEMKEWLKNNIWPQDQVSDYMADTAIHRAQWIRSDGSKSLPEILAEYPRFLDTPGMVGSILSFSEYNHLSLFPLPVSVKDEEENIVTGAAVAQEVEWVVQ